MATGSVALSRELDFDGARIAAGASRKALDALAAGLVNHPEIFLVEVMVTTTEADAALGQKRAEAVTAHLTRNRPLTARDHAMALAVSRVNEPVGRWPN